MHNLITGNGERKSTFVEQSVGHCSLLHVCALNSKRPSQFVGFNSLVTAAC